jgi:putative ABC transport system permease protein
MRWNGNMLIKKLFRTAFKYKAQFISMIIMIGLGMGIFIGANMDWYGIEKNAYEFMDNTYYADYRLYNEQGFSSDDIDKINSIEGVSKASRVLSVNVDVKNSNNSLSLFSVEDYVVSKMQIMSGSDYDENADGFWISDEYAKANNLNLGDNLTITYKNIEISGEILGLAKSSEYLICVADANQLMPDFKTFGFIYVTPKKIFDTLGQNFYTQINIISDLSKQEMESNVNSALGKTTLLLSKSEHTSYAGVNSEIGDAKTTGAILPVLFLLIGVLTMVTTMHRITINEKTQIGTLKALGFKDKKIILHYTSYGLFIGIMGSILGIGIGFLFANLLVGENGMQSTYMDLPHWNLYVPWFCYLVLIITILFLGLISYISVRKILKGTPSETLRPYTPKKVKPLKIEKAKSFSKLSFSIKWNLRDIFRHKSRSLMTLFGVVGCVILLIGAFGMNDTMKEYLNVMDNKIFNYQTQVNISETASNDEAITLASELNGDWGATSSVEFNDKAISLDIYNVTNNKIRFINKGNKIISLSNDGVYICIRLADTGIKVGDEISFSPYGSDEIYTVKVAGVIRSVITENITMTKEYADSVGLSYHINYIYTDVEQSNITASDIISGTQSKQNLMSSYDSYTEILNEMIAIFMIGAVILGGIVLYNLGVMSYVERYRELATLKVVGFKDRNIGKILISQNIWLTIVGIIIGLPAGVGILKLLLLYMATEYELKLTIGILTYILSFVFTLGISFVVSFFISRKNKKINMVEALKGVE